MKARHTEEYVDGTSAAPWPQLDGVRPKTSPSLVDDDRRSEDGEGRGGAKSNNGAQPVGRSPAGGREEGLDRPRKDEDDGFLSACDEVLSNEGPDLWGFGQSERRSPMADSACHTRLEDDTLTKDRVQTALKVLSTMSPAEVQQRLNAEDLSTPLVSVKPKTPKKESTKKKLESVSPPHTYRRTVEDERRRQMFESASIEGDDTDEELPVSQKRSLPAKSGPKKKAGLQTLILGHLRTYSEVLDCILFLRNRRIRQNHST